MAKKSASKKTAKKTAKKSSGEAPNFIPNLAPPVDLLSDEGADWMSNLNEELIATASRRKNRPVGFRTADQIVKECLPYRHFMLQYLTGTIGLPMGVHVDVVGETGIGKTTWVWDTMAFNLQRGCPTLVLNCEGKEPDKSRLIRCMSSDPVQAKRMMKAITSSKVTTLQRMDDEIQRWVKGVRAKGWPKRLPVQVAVDPISKLLADEEAAGFVNYGDFMKPEMIKKMKATGKGKIGMHAIFHHAFSRRMAAMSEEENMNLFLVHHQNDESIEASAAKARMPSFMRNQMMESANNTTHIGGRASAQTASLILVFTRAGDAKGADKRMRGHIVNVNAFKNSYGPSKRMIRFELRTEHVQYDRRDEGGNMILLDRAVQYDGQFARMLADNTLLGTRVDSDVYASKELGVVGVTAEEFGAFVQADKAALQKLGQMFAIHGYVDPVNDILQGQQYIPPIAPAAKGEVVTEEDEADGQG